MTRKGKQADIIIMLIPTIINFDKKLALNQTEVTPEQIRNWL